MYNRVCADCFRLLIKLYILYEKKKKYQLTVKLHIILEIHLAWFAIELTNLEYKTVVYDFVLIVIKFNNIELLF